MKNLLAICLVLMMLCLHAQSVVRTDEPVVDRWEIVTDIYIGVQTECLTDEERQEYGSLLRRRQGLKIKRVIPGSPAEKAGLISGDLILKNNGASIASMEDLLLSVRNTRPGELIHFNILRNGTKLPICIQVEALPEPVVVAYATLRQRDLPSMASIAENQSQIAKHLVSNTTNLQAIYDEFEKINNRFPAYARPGHIRLYYATDVGYITVTAYTDRITVTVQRELQVEIYHLRKQGDTLPNEVKRLIR